jgi:hypothetical protein
VGPNQNYGVFSNSTMLAWIHISGQCFICVWRRAGACRRATTRLKLQPNFASDCGYRDVYAYVVTHMIECPGAFNDIWRFVVPVSTWTNYSMNAGELRIEPRSGHGLTTVDECLYVFGGQTDIGEHPDCNFGCDLCLELLLFCASFSQRPLEIRCFGEFVELFATIRI